MVFATQELMNTHSHSRVSKH